MTKYTIIEHSGQKWLTPTSPYATNEPDLGEHSIFEMPYIGSKPAGTTLDESEIREVKQTQLLSAWMTVEDKEIDDLGGTIGVRTAYTDVEPTEQWYPGMEYQALFDHMQDEHGLTLLQSELDDIIRICKSLEV